MILTPEQAASMPCPVSRTFAAAQPTCRADGCILWRWRPVAASDQAYVAALKVRVAETGEKPLHHPKAAALARGDVTPDRGWCGLGGRPEA